MSVHSLSVTSNNPAAAGGGSAGGGSIDARLAVLEHIADDTRRTLAAITTELGRIHARLDSAMEAQRLDMAGVQTRMDRLAGDQRSDFKWLLGAGAAATACVLGLMAHGFHWL